MTGQSDLATAVGMSNSAMPRRTPIYSVSRRDRRSGLLTIKKKRAPGIKLHRYLVIDAARQACLLCARAWRLQRMGITRWLQPARKPP